ncbi:MAG: hypothetical protein MK111_12170 [Crocosphaera sp.]|uniref:hypothetical protein n=1 Tax=Crocosphaera sp. TaxID=2729996 RepID=UPI002590557C|nr:hypothetical protein [Crocosphaera sp.]MCH2228073.1 hypothetical protein [Candidatus Caenarcaniphilales bacterium]MCH2245383.1 hypothetical protein [Crocosphaera sp.]
MSKNQKNCSSKGGGLPTPIKVASDILGATVATVAVKDAIGGEKKIQDNIR